jgi:ribosome-binding protein aMBF1 (putative translation factor)
MTIPLNDMLKRLPKARREKVRRQTEHLITEYTSLRKLRQARSQKQATLARKLKVKQAAVSKIESRKDMYVSTLRSLIEAMGGQLEITAKFPGNKLVNLTHFHDVK